MKQSSLRSLGPLGRRDRELVERLRHVVHEGVPLVRRDAQVPVRALHVLAGVFLRTSGAQHSISVTRYLKSLPAVPCGARRRPRGLALSRGSAMTTGACMVAMLFLVVPLLKTRCLMCPVSWERPPLCGM